MGYPGCMRRYTGAPQWDPDLMASSMFVPVPFGEQPRGCMRLELQHCSACILRVVSGCMRRPGQCACLVAAMPCHGASVLTSLPMLASQ